MEHNYSVFDAHCDTLCFALDDGKSLYCNDCHIDFERLSRCRKYTQVFACFIDPVYKSCAAERTLDLIDAYHSQKDAAPENVKTVLSIEGGEGIYSLAALRNYYRLGVRIAALTWNFTNHIAAGALEKDENKGLTEFGKSVVKEMNRIGMLIDVSHLNRKSFFDIAQITDMPLIATHSCSDYICSHPRNLTDEQFEVIKNTGGCVGINFYPEFLTRSAECTVDDIVRHIDRFMELGGENNIGIGADFDGVDRLPDGINGAQDTYKLFERLARLGYSDGAIEKISHKNFERVLESL